MLVADVIARIESAAPLKHAAAWDQSGVQVAGKRTTIEKLAVALDPSVECIDAAVLWGADFVLTHHPLALKPSLPTRLNAFHRVLSLLLDRGAWLYAAHTSLDAQPHGPVRWLAEALALHDVQVLEPTASVSGRWFRVLGPEQDIAAFEQRLRAESGVEFFNSGPFSVECVCPANLVHAVRAAAEAVNDNALRIVSQDLDYPEDVVGFGFVGDLPGPMEWSSLARRLVESLNSSSFACAGQIPDSISRVACCPGSGASMLPAVKRAKAQIFITGDLKYHDARTAEELGLFVVDVGHFSLEETMMRIWADQLRARLKPDRVDVAFFAAREGIVRNQADKY